MANKEVTNEELVKVKTNSTEGTLDPALTREQELESQVKDLTEKNNEIYNVYQALSIKYNKLFDLYADLFDKYLGNVRKQ